MTIDPIEVTYYYVKKSQVTVKYIDKETGKEITDPTIIPGHEGDPYQTEPKVVSGYDLMEEPKDKSGNTTEYLPSSSGVNIAGYTYLDIIVISLIYFLYSNTY